ncbi:pyridoxamine 5'-phosphate oxidase family protein [Cyanobacteria bacterium FACHB-DQ100]|uniref:pyridoxamine 5'-phosphate oxidase family protein n=1 Tax=unclassified Leptolyngbya TaxID=2650499 RepID=UPI0016808C12|nr:pyridoxamine 5'-phosphate oxidase family protein [Leptolyngbya sp. FACHB-17]MBD1823222.1 pyridoxamine 5'-phosphate oxidase family protein [Cyanobacteria bacterium FACHB-DQ100]MBD2083112.1 pyridoxamine 5'-phosphate oxidase family protein [Leptolyngbya sp. FACHB-17]
MTLATDSDQSLQKLRDIIKDINFCMLTTIDDDGSLRSRPMSVNSEVEANGDLWFFTYASSHKVTEVNHHHQVNVSFSAPDKQRYVSLSGTAELVRDRAKMEELWTPELKAWFPKELDEPDIALLKVSATKAEYWDAPAGWVAKAYGFVKAATTGKTEDLTEDVKLTLN